MPPKRKNSVTNVDLTSFFPDFKKSKGNIDDDDELPIILKFKHNQEISFSSQKLQETKTFQKPINEYKTDLERYFDDIYKVILKNSKNRNMNLKTNTELNGLKKKIY